MSFLRKLFFRFRYLKTPPWDTGISPPELITSIKETTPATALDLGCGSGTNAITLAQNGWQVTAVDFIPRAIQISRRKAATVWVDVQFSR